MSDPERVVNCVYVLCREQCQAREMTDEDFGHSLDGDAYERCQTAFSEELIDFFPKAARASLRRLSATGKSLGAELLRLANGRLDSLDIPAEAEKILKRLQAKTPNEPSGNLAVSSESIQVT